MPLGISIKYRIYVYINSDGSITLLDKTKEIVIVNKGICGHFNKNIGYKWIYIAIGQSHLLIKPKKLLSRTKRSVAISVKYRI